jgi:PAS domain S-box-containing protein
MGQSLDLIIPERQRGRHWEGYEKVMQTGVSRYGVDLLSVPAVRKDGSRLSLEFSIVLVRDEAGQPTGVAAIMRDVTVRWQQERELKARLAALETKST